MNQKYIVLISGAAIVIAVAGMLITYQLFSSQQLIPSQEITTQQKTSSISDILPTRDDVGTTWKIFPSVMSPFDIMTPPEINKNAFVSTAHLTKLKSEIENSQGYQEGIAQIFWRNLDGQDFVIGIWVFKFDLPDNAWFRYNDTVTRIYEEGGFVEYPVKQAGMPCYGTITSKLKGESYDRMNLYCVKDNIFYQIYAANAPHLSDNDKVTVVGFSKTISNKILPRLSVTADKISYRDTDSIVISGTVKDPMELPLTMRILDPNHILVQIMQVDLSKDGSFSVNIKPEGVMWKTKGTYTIVAEYGSSKAETYFELNPTIGIPASVTGSGVVRFYNVVGGGGQTENRVYKELASALPTDNWTADFDYKFTYSSIPGQLPFALTTTSDNPLLKDETRIMIQHGIDANQLRMFGLAGIGNSDAISIFPNTQYYVRLERAPTQLILSVFSDQSRSTHITGSPVIENILPTDFRGLKYLQHDGCMTCGPGRVLTAELDNTVITHSETTRTKIIFEDDYSSDIGWTQIGSSVTVNKPYSTSPEIVTLTVSEDSYTHGFDPLFEPVNFDGQGLITKFHHPQFGSRDNRKTWLKFELPVIPQQVTQATLRLYVTGFEPSGSGIEVYRHDNNNWSESTITFLNEPARFADLSVGPFGSATFTTKNQYYDIDVTQALSTSPRDQTITLVLVGTTLNNGVDFADGESANPPQLVLDNSDNNPLGTYSPYLEITASIKHDIVGGKVKSITADMESKTVLISIEATYDGVLVITIPRSVADNLVADEDDSFFVIIDGKEVDYKEISKTSTDRTLSILFKKGAQEIEIIGTYQLS